MKVLEIFAFLELLSTATKSIMESDSTKGHWACKFVYANLELMD